MGAPREGCLACDLASGRQPLPGGLIHRTGYWLVEHCVGPLGIGTLIVKPERHVEHVADLTPEEAGELGLLLRQAAAVVTTLCSPEQVYTCLWSHTGAKPGHIHYVIQPVTKELMQEYGDYGPQLQVAMFNQGESPDPEKVAAFAKTARHAFSAT